MEALTVNQFADKIKCKRDLYEALIRNGYFLPSIKSSVVSEKYLVGILEGNIYCPKIESIKLKGCPSPPSKEVLIAKLLEALKQRGIENHGLDELHLPDCKWLLALLSTLAPNDEIYRKDYRPPPRAKKIEEQKTILVPQSFLGGLPSSKSKVKAKHLKVISEGMARQKLHYLKKAIADMRTVLSR